MIGHTYRKRWITRTVERFEAGYYWCRDRYMDGTERVCMPTRGQLERWLKGAVEL